MNSDRKNLSQLIKNSKVNYISMSKYVALIAAVIMIIGVFIISFLGFNLGMDFAGGTVVNVIVENSEDSAVFEDAQSKINEVLSDFGLTASLYQHADTDNGSAVTVRYKDKEGLSEEDMLTLNEEVVDALFEKFGYDNTDPEQQSMVYGSQRIGAKTSSDLLLNSMLAILIAIVCMLIYIALRFEFASGASAIIALVHDVLIMCALVAMFRIEVNSSFIAAIITIIGYSINNTIVVFDRIRENSRNELYADKTRAFIANISVKETMSRTLYTSLTTILTISLLAIFGVASIREFALPIIFGLVAGTISSIFISPVLWTFGMPVKKKKVKVEDQSVSQVDAVTDEK